MTIRLSTLGVPSCRVDDVELADLPAQKARFALLVYLAVERNVSRDEVAALFWAESNDDRARHALSQSIYELKRLLGDGWLQPQSGRLVIGDDVQVDVLDFTRLCAEESYERAIELYRGPFLSGFFLSNCKGFETWVDRQRSHLERAHRRARRECVNGLVEARRVPAALEVARRWAELDPFEDEANHKLIELLALSGKRTEALREYAAYERRLRDELAIEPLEDTRRLVESLRNETSAPTVKTVSPGPDSAPPQPRERLSPLPTIEAPGLIKELSRRRVFRMAVWYGATAFTVTQFAQTMQDAFALPQWILTTTAITALAGFPLAVLLSWHFDLTAEGLKREPASNVMSRRSVAMLLAVAILGGGLWFSGFKRGSASYAVDLPLDSTRFAILPFRYSPDVSVRLNEDQLLQDAMARWTDISVVDLFQVRDALARNEGDLKTDAALRVARSLRAGRYIRGEISRFRDSLRIHAAVYDAQRDGAPVVDRTVRVSVSLSGADSAFAALADALLFQGDAPPGRHETTNATRSWAARRAYVDALRDIQEWRLAHADTLFSRALDGDPQYNQARLWLSIVRAWAGGESATWGYLAEQVQLDSTRLTPRDHELARGMAEIARGNYESACGRIRQLTQAGPHDFVAWYGLGDCLIRDDAVRRDARSPSGWAFRTSRHDALKAFHRAFQMMPSLHAAIRGDAYQQLRRLYFTGRSQVRLGKALPPDTTSFVAYPTLVADTLAFVPLPTWQASTPPAWLSPRMVDDAIQNQRRLFYEITRTWRTAFPRSPEAAEAVAIAMQMLGNASSIDTLTRARSLASDPVTRNRIAATEVWLRVRFAIPLDMRQLQAAVSLADSLLESARKTPGDPALASIATVLGRPSLAMQLYASAGPPEEAAAGTHLALLAALNAPIDSLKLAETALVRVINAGMSSQAATLARERWLDRAAVLLWPRTLSVNVPVQSPSRRAQQALAAGDTAGALRTTEDMLAARRRGSPQDRTLDLVYSDAMLLRALGQKQRAAAWLDSTLLSLSASSPAAFFDPVKAAALVRAMSLRAELAAELGDRRTAAMWTRIVSLLWQNCESTLRLMRDKPRTYAFLPHSR